jgi:hypothetical protein
MSAVLLRRLPGVLAVAAALLALRAASLAPLGAASADGARLRLSWSARPERLEHCRRLSDAELAARPQHMRLRWECEGKFARYLLTVRIDGRLVASDTVHGGGLRQDRPMHLLREYVLAPGRRNLSIALRRIDAAAPPDTAAAGDTSPGTAAADRETREGQERRVRRAEAVPSDLAIDSTIAVAAGRVVLVTYASTARRLELRNGAR